jgi:hypothetical protein
MPNGFFCISAGTEKLYEAQLAVKSDSLSPGPESNVVTTQNEPE